MAEFEFEFGPVEVYHLGFEDHRPDPATLSALVELTAGGGIRLLDLVVVSRSVDGELSVREFEELTAASGLPALDLEASGLIGDEDVDELGATMAPGASGAILAIELIWAKKLASRFAAAGGEVLKVERIPAQVVNEVLASASEE